MCFFLDYQLVLSTPLNGASRELAFYDMRFELHGINELAFHPALWLVRFI